MVGPKDVEGVAEGGDEILVSTLPAQFGGVDFARESEVELVAMPSDLKPLHGRDGALVGALSESMSFADCSTECLLVTFNHIVACR